MKSLTLLFAILSVPLLFSHRIDPIKDDPLIWLIHLQQCDVVIPYCPKSLWHPPSALLRPYLKV